MWGALLGGHSRGVATYVNRPGDPPYTPFQADEIARAQAVAAVEAVVLRHLDQRRRLRVAGMLCEGAARGEAAAGRW